MLRLDHSVGCPSGLAHELRRDTMQAVLPLVVILLEEALLSLDLPEDWPAPLALVLLAWALVRLRLSADRVRASKP